MAESHFQFQQLKTLRKSPHSPWKKPIFMAYLSHLPNHNFKFAFSKSSTISFGRCSLSHRRTAILDLPFRPLFAAARPRTLCKMSDSDIMSQLELGKPEERRKPHKQVTGIFWIILLNLGIYAADHVFQVRAIKDLYLYHGYPEWYQFLTATFCHADWRHLSSNLFFLYIFGKLVEEEEGNFGLWLSYILTGVGANLVSWLILPRNAVSIGASGAVFGLFTISVFVKMSWDWRKILEVFILGQFVVERVRYSF
ncbi:rhomboid-like protein 11, chloroplastic isoform X2 [Morus notabilis]|uniref:rhomboid-like protein 11, chloroplastic isoform X2 n=1 Tax=Morus notabilis TaxID=981085 RepID=UPI000CED09D5|nr:rhomboid-like protein 11, chloroplastic isoform X2 [Morus notabilis]